MFIKLSIEARSAVRKAVTNHVGWKAYRLANNLSSSDLKANDLQIAAKFLGIDIAAIAARASENANAGKQSIRDNGAEAARAFEEMNSTRNQEAREVFSDDEPREAETVRVNNDKSATVEKLMRLLAELSATSINEDDVAAIVQRHIKAALEANGASVTINLTNDAWNEPKALKGTHHPKFATMLRCATARDVSGFVPNIWITGPAGSGKTYAARKVSEALELAFHSNGAIGMSHELLGFTDGSGVYHRTAFREAFENGGVYLFDEVDGSDNAALLALNAALANGHATFPDGNIERHKDCIVMATANTWGLGANAEFVGRAKIDGAFLDRFPVKFFWDYDLHVEQMIYGSQEYAEMVQRARAKARDHGLKVMITPRATMAGAALVAQGFTMQEAAELTYLANLTPEQRRMVEAD